MTTHYTPVVNKAASNITAKDEEESVGTASDDDLESCVAEVIDYGTDWRRFLVLFTFWLIGTINSCLWITYSTCVDQVKEYYKVTTSQVDTVNTMYMICFIALFWSSGVICGKLGLKWALVISGLLNSISCALRLISVPVKEDGLGLLIASGVAGGMCQIVVISAPPLASNLWFPPAERGFATAISASAVYVGSSLGMLLPTQMIPTDDATSADFNALYWLQFAMAAAGLVLSIIIPKRPRVPPSPSAQKHGISEHHIHRHPLHHVRHIIKQVVCNKQFILLNCVCAFVLGTTWEIITLWPQVAKSFNVTNKNMGWAGFAANITAVVTCPIFGTLLVKVIDFKRLMIIEIMAGSAPVIVYTLVTAFIDWNSFTVAASTQLVFTCFIGLLVCNSAFFPTVFEFGVELTFPLSEEISGAVLMLSPSAFSLILVKVLGSVLGDGDTPKRSHSVLVMGINAMLMLLAVVILLFLFPKYRRRSFEMRKVKHDEEVRASQAARSSLGLNQTQ